MSIDLEHRNTPKNSRSEQTTEAFDSLNNTGNDDPENINIRITGMNDLVKDSVEEGNSKEDHEYKYVNT